jgi:DNA-directed RNA polymerase subunit RPC12/RpoP
MNPEYKCNQCGWEGDEADIVFDTVHGPWGSFDEESCPNCGSTWPVPFDDIIP